MKTLLKKEEKKIECTSTKVFSSVSSTVSINCRMSIFWVSNYQLFPRSYIYKYLDVSIKYEYVEVRQGKTGMVVIMFPFNIPAEDVD